MPKSPVHTKPIPSPNDRPIYLRTPEAADFLGVAPRTLNNWRSAGIGPEYHRVGGSRIVYEVNALIAFVEAGHVCTSGGAA